MNEIRVAGRQNFMGLDIPVVLGGFGEGKKCISDKTIAEIHGQPVTEIRRRIGDNIKRFSEDIDFIDMKQHMGESQSFEDEGMGESHTLGFLIDLGYTRSAITQAEHIYILSEHSKMSSQCFSRFWHDFDDYFDINAYANLPKVRFDEALAYINRWQPPINMQLEIGNLDMLIEYLSGEETEAGKNENECAAEMGNNKKSPQLTAN